MNPEKVVKELLRRSPKQPDEVELVEQSLTSLGVKSDTDVKSLLKSLRAKQEKGVKNGS